MLPPSSREDRPVTTQQNYSRHYLDIPHWMPPDMIHMEWTLS